MEGLAMESLVTVFVIEEEFERYMLCGEFMFSFVGELVSGKFIQLHIPKEWIVGKQRNRVWMAYCNHKPE
jgi:hypothetical protein